MPTREKKQEKSIYGMLVRNSALMIVLIILMGVLFLAFYYFAINNLLPGLDIDKLISQENRLEQEEYSKVRAGNSLGKKGYFEVVNENADVLYCSSDDKNQYPDDYLEYIPTVYSGIDYSIFPIGSDEDRKYLLVKSDEDSDEWMSGIAVLDQDRKVLYSSMELGENQFSSTVVKAITVDDEFDEEFLVQKYPFQTADGQQRYLLIHTDENHRAFRNSKYRLALLEVSIFFVLALLTIYFVNMHTAHLVKEPLDTLKAAMGELGKKGRRKRKGGQQLLEVSQVMNAFDTMEDKLEKSERQREKMQEQQRKMLADISHDMKTPVTVIQGYVDAINDGLVTEDEMHAYLKIIGDKAQYLGQLTDTFGEFSRLEHPGFTLRLEKTDLCEYIREYMAGRYNELQLDGFRVSADIPEDLELECNVDQGHLKRVFENIINNSVRHTEKGTEIFVSVRKEGGQAVVEMGDDGPGIPEEMKDKAFDPFVVGDSARTSGKGTGLGLSIAKTVVEQHGGTIELRKGGKGTCFIIRLPLCR